MRSITFSDPGNRSPVRTDPEHSGYAGRSRHARRRPPWLHPAPPSRDAPAAPLAIGRSDRGVKRILLGEQRPDVRPARSQAHKPRQQPARLRARSAVLRLDVYDLSSAILAPAGERSRPCSGQSVVLLHGQLIVQLSGAARFPIA